MPHHASPLSSILQAAAARAWSRRVHSLPSALPVPGTHVNTPTLAENPAATKTRISAPVGARPIKLKAFSEPGFDRRDPGRVTDLIYSDPPPDTGPSVLQSTEPSPILTMPPPTTTQSLFRNLLFMMSNPPFSIHRAIDYHFDSPKHLHSTRSFNLLISLALHNTSFGKVGRLFGIMRAESIPENMQTRKLHVRWLVRTGRWKDAWKRVLEITGQQNASVRLPMKPIPLPLWLELFGSQKRGALRHRVMTVDPATASNTIPGSPNAIYLDARNSITPWKRLRLVPCPSQVLQRSQYQALMRVSPLLARSGQVQILPRTVFVIIQAMHQAGQKSLALSTALSYLQSLPPRLRRCDRRRILDLVNLHLSMVVRHKKPGLKQHFTQRRALWKFLDARPDLTPSSTTLFLLLGPLRGSSRSGTLAMRCLHLFEKRWGPRVQSRLVRRRVASLALKEGRLDIVEAMMKLEWRCRAFDDAFSRTIYPSNPLRRRPWRVLFTRRGVENQRWRLLEEKYRRLRLKSDS